MTVEAHHVSEHVIDKASMAITDGIMKHIRHAADKDSARLLPSGRLLEPIMMNLWSERIFLIIAESALEPVRHSFGVAVLAAFTYRAASGNWIPNLITPFNLCWHCRSF